MKKNYIRRFLTAFLVTATIVGTLFTTGCSEALTASNNLSVAADNFEIQRRIVFYNA